MNPIKCKVCQLPIYGCVSYREDTPLDIACLSYYERYKNRYPELTHKEWLQKTKSKVRVGKRGIPAARPV